MYIVRFIKVFVNGHLKGVSVPATLTFVNYNKAMEYIVFCRAHYALPVKPCVGTARYTIRNASMEGTDTQLYPSQRRFER